MANIVQAVLVILAGASVAMADIMIKKAATGSSFLNALKNPLMIGAALLYISQIVFLTYVFVKAWKLGIVGAMQIVVYSVFLVSTGFFIFKENFSVHQYIGLVLAISGVILINL